MFDLIYDQLPFILSMLFCSIVFDYYTSKKKNEFFQKLLYIKNILHAKRKLCEKTSLLSEEQITCKDKKICETNLIEWNHKRITYQAWSLQTIDKLPLLHKQQSSGWCCSRYWYNNSTDSTDVKLDEFNKQWNIGYCTRIIL